MNADKRNYHCTDAILHANAGLILAACGTYPAINARLLTDYVATTHTLLTQAIAGTGGQSNNATELTGLTAAQNTALATIIRLCGLAARCAKTAFRGQTTKLREQFGVADGTGEGLPDITARALKIHAGCTDADNLAGLREQGWIPADSDALETAILALTGANNLQELRKATNKGSTAAYIQLNNQLYFNITSIQNAARIQFADDTPANHVAREIFRIGLFPPIINEDAPTIPKKFKVTPGAPGSTVLNIDWNIAKRADDYVVTIRNKATGDIITTHETTDNKATLTLTGTPSGTEITVVLVARNETGESKPTKTLPAVVP